MASAAFKPACGTFKIELLEAHAVHIMQDGAKLAALTSVCAITEAALPERHPYLKQSLAGMNLTGYFLKLHRMEKTTSCTRAAISNTERL